MYNLLLRNCSPEFRLGIRLYYCVIPLFAWAMSSWVLLVVCPIYVLLMRDYDNNDYVEDELEVMYKDTEFGRYNRVRKEDTKVVQGYMRQESIPEENNCIIPSLSGERQL